MYQRRGMFRAILILSCLIQGLVFAIPNEPHPDYDLEALQLELNNQDFRPLVMGMAMLSNGDMVIVTSDDLTRGGSVSNHTIASSVYLVSGLDGNQPSVQEIATNFRGLAGVVVVNDRIFVSDRDALYELISTDTDPDIEQRTKIVDWPAGPTWHQWAFTPMYYDGSFYVPWSGTIIPGGPSNTSATDPMSGGFLKFDIDGSNLDVFSSGLRSPNGSGISPSGVMMVTDNQGSWLPASTISHMQEGKSNGHVHQPPTTIDLWDYVPPTAWLPHGPVSRSPSEPIYMDRGPFEGQWVFGDINHEGLMRMFVEDVNGSLQGAVFPFSRGINQGNASAGVNRLVWGPDDALYIGVDGRIAGNWSSSDTPFPIYKFKHSGSNEFEIKAVRSKNNGMELEFTKPVNTSQQNSWTFTVTQYSYVRQIGYGTGKTADESRTVSSTQISDDGTRVMLVINGLKEQSDGPADTHNRQNGYVTYIDINGIRSATGETPWNEEVWYTLNNISPDAFDPSVSLGRLASPNSEFFKVHTLKNQIALTFKEDGQYKVTLKTLKGENLQFHNVSGAGTHYLAKPQGKKGLYIVNIEGQSKTYSQKILF